MKQGDDKKPNLLLTGLKATLLANVAKKKGELEDE
jgi:hypothetical protein